MKMSDTVLKGEIALMKVLLRATERGIFASRPVNDSGKYDLILDDGKKLWRTQVKYSKSEYAPGAARVKMSVLKRSGGNRKNIGHRPYTSKEVDVIIAYLAATDKVYWLPRSIWKGKTEICLRYRTARNNQKNGCIMAYKYEW
jgi:hypothetical protein